MGRLQSEVSNGKTTSYGYDLNGTAVGIKYHHNDRELRLFHDAAGRLASLQDSLSGVTRTTSFGYDVGGRLLREDLANGLVETSSYDRMGRRTGKQLRTPDWNVLCGSRYTYDFNSNVTSLRETTGPLAVPSRTVTMEYDERGRLLREEQTGAVERTERHGYDLADNRLWSRKSEGGVDTSRDYEYGSAANGYNSNQLANFAEKVGAASPVTTNYLYDDNGNRTQRSRGGQSDTYVYDTSDRLIEMTLGTAGPDNGTYRYAYDHASRRIGREVPGGGKRNFAFAGSSPAVEWTPGINVFTENIGGGVGGRLYSYEDGGSPVWDFHDARGDLLGQTTSGGTLTYRALNDASGRKVTGQGGRSGGYGANSKWEEPAGLANDGFRYRDLDIGLFINRDPAGFIDGLNVYNYVGHNSWSFYDANGLSTTGALLDSNQGSVNSGTVTPQGARIAGLIEQGRVQEAGDIVRAAHLAAHLRRLEMDIVSSWGVPKLPPIEKIESEMTHAARAARSDLREIFKLTGMRGAFASDYIALPSPQEINAFSQALQPVVKLAKARMEAGDAASANWVAEQNSFAHKGPEIAMAAADLPMHAAAGVGNYVTKVGASTGMAFGWNGWANGGGFGLVELSSVDRAFALADVFVPQAKALNGTRVGTGLIRSEVTAVGRSFAGTAKVPWGMVPRGLPTGVNPVGKILVIGRHADVLAAEKWVGHEIFRGAGDAVDAANTKWMADAIAEGRTFYVATKISASKMLKPDGQLSWFAKELTLLRESGYQPIGNYLVPPHP